MKGGSRKRWLIWCALSGGVGCYLLDAHENQPTEIAQDVKRARSERSTRTDSPASRESVLLTLAPRPGPAPHEMPIDMFARRDWTPPPPPAEPAPTVAPTAPPLPYVYAGKKQEEGAWEIYVTRGQESHILRQGATFDGNYMVERIDPPTMVLKYLPLGERQTMVIGE